MKVLCSPAAELSEALRDKERRAQQHLERCGEERGRKMEEQRKKEKQRRLAAEEKRRQQQEAEKVRGHSTLKFSSNQLFKHTDIIFFTAEKLFGCCWF